MFVANHHIISTPQHHAHLAMREPQKIGNLEFTSNLAAINHIRSLLQQIGPCNTVPECHRAMLFELALRHPNHEDKMRLFRDFSICRNMLNPTALELNIVNTDGTLTDISWRKCVTGVQKSKLIEAFRTSIQHQIDTFRRETKPTHCDLCGASLNGRMHIDHVTPFDHLVKAFMNTCNSTPPSVFNGEVGTHRSQFAVVDHAFETSFVAYHQAHAVLRALCPPCNLKRPRSKA